MYFIISPDASSSSRAVEGWSVAVTVYVSFCVSMCPQSTRKMTWAVNTKLVNHCHSWTAVYGCECVCCVLCHPVSLPASIDLLPCSCGWKITRHCFSEHLWPRVLYVVVTPMFYYAPCVFLCNLGWSSRLWLANSVVAAAALLWAWQILTTITARCRWPREALSEYLRFKCES